MDIWAILIVAMVMLVMIAVVLGVLAGVGAWSLARRNRLAPDIETGAPLPWLWSPTQPARLHRRLQRAVGPIHEPVKGRRGRAAAAPATDAAVGPAATIDDVCRAITGQATALDREVVQLARLPRRARRGRLRLLQGEVTQIERLTVRVHVQRTAQAEPATIWGHEPRTRGEALSHIDRHLDALADAHDELHAIERAHGLDDPDRILSAIEARHQAPQPQPQPPPPTAPPPAPGRSSDRAPTPARPGASRMGPRPAN